MANDPISDLAQRLAQAFRDSPLQDVERNMKVMLGSFFERFDLVRREDFEVQRELLEKSATRIAELEARVAHIESIAAHDEERQAPN